MDRPFVLRVDDDGTEKWRRRLDDAPGTVTDAIALDDGYVVVGHEKRSSNESNESSGNERGLESTGWAARLGPSGDVRWREEYVERSGGTSRIRAAVRDGDGFAFAGRTDHPEYGDTPIDTGVKAWFVRATLNGRVRAESTPPADEVETLAQTADGGLLLGGRSTGGFPDFGPVPAAWLAKLPPNPMSTELEWTLTPQESEIRAIAGRPDGSAVGAAPTEPPPKQSTVSNDSSLDAGAVIGVSTAGEKQWTTRFSADEILTPRRLLADESGVLLVGEVTEWRQDEESDGGEEGPTHGVAERYGTDGERRWRVRYEGEHQDVVTDAVALDDGWVLAGSQSRNGTPVSWFAKITLDGTLRRERTYDPVVEKTSSTSS